MHHFVKTVGVAFFLAHNPLYAFSIDDIHVKSAVNDHFNADIRLSLNAGDNPNDIHVQLAPIDKFVERGVPWDRGLLKLKFDPILRNNDAVVIRVISAGLIVEPVLVFLLQASSQKKTIYRRFTVLLDPPANYESMPVKREFVSENRTNRRRFIASREDNYQRPQRERKPRMAAAKPLPVSNPVVVDIKKKTNWVSVRKNDGLLKIAKRINYGSRISDEQMAIALFNTNPRAFFAPNINALKAGQSLRIPDDKIVTALRTSDAKSEFYRQNRAWKDKSVPKVNPVAPPIASVAVGVVEPIVKKKLTLSAPTDMWINDGEMLTDISSATPIKLNNSVGEVSDKVINLQLRLENIERQMTEMQKILLVKDQQLALLQSEYEKDKNSFLNKAVHYLKAESRNVFYIIVGVITLLTMGVLGFYGTKKLKTKTVHVKQD